MPAGLCSRPSPSKQAIFGWLQANALKNEEVYFLDIGANIGTFSIAVAAHGFSVIAFEAMFSNQQAIRLSICANPGMEERVELIGKVDSQVAGRGYWA